ncbi:hypothetical protein CYMTET_31361 [Cymbomonas tetramitiformis]|uniref:Uncharacterized protein n=1 Tax=Cymbomonas tetramitiformis TaxID=36881 RepID=A0AAE0KSZ5_9CHLO|nr:hypothetical protein CYMTET_31361 [Cymbomonas tetramitiformis]
MGTQVLAFRHGVRVVAVDASKHLADAANSRASRLSELLKHHLRNQQSASEASCTAQATSPTPPPPPGHPPSHNSRTGSVLPEKPVGVEALLNPDTAAADLAAVVKMHVERWEEAEAAGPSASGLEGAVERQDAPKVQGTAEVEGAAEMTGMAEVAGAAEVKGSEEVAVEDGDGEGTGALFSTTGYAARQVDTGRPEHRHKLVLVGLHACGTW